MRCKHDWVPAEEIRHVVRVIKKNTKGVLPSVLEREDFKTKAKYCLECRAFSIRIAVK